MTMFTQFMYHMKIYPPGSVPTPPPQFPITAYFSVSYCISAEKAFQIIGALQMIELLS